MHLRLILRQLGSALITVARNQVQSDRQHPRVITIHWQYTAKRAAHRAHPRRAHWLARMQLLSSDGQLIQLSDLWAAAGGPDRRGCS